MAVPERLKAAAARMMVLRNIESSWLHEREASPFPLNAALLRPEANPAHTDKN